MERNMSTQSTATELRKKLIHKAYRNPDLRSRILPLVKNANNKRVLTASQRFDLVEAITLAKSTGKKAADPIAITKMPGFSPMQLKQQIDRLADIQREIELLSTQYESVLSQLKGLEKEEKAGLDKLKKAAKEMRDKGKFVAEAEKALLQFTAYTQEKRPGIEQMIARPQDTKWGDKAGDLFGRIAAKLGADISKAVEEMYRQCEEDLTHTASAVRGLKIVTKTSSLHPQIIKSAGLVDTVVAIKEWIAGKKDALAQRIINFAGDIGRWLKGFVERTKLVKKNRDMLIKSIDGAKKDIDKLLAGA